MSESSTIIWFKSSYSNNGGDCVEVSTSTLAATGTILLRDSKNPDAGHFAFTPSEWTAFLKGARNGEFDI